MPTSGTSTTLPTPEYLDTVFHYDPATGSLTWKESRSGRPIGTLAGWNQLSSGGKRMGRFVRVDGRQYAVHRVAWTMMTRSWPTGVVSFRDEDPLNLRWSNLFHETQEEHRMRLAEKRGSTGLVGARRARIKDGPEAFTARITVRGKMIHLGVFATAEEAHAAYLAAKANPQAAIAHQLPGQTQPAKVAAAATQLTTRERIMQAIHDLASRDRTFSRQRLVDMTGLRMSVVDDHLDRIRDDGLVVKVVAGVYELVRDYPPFEPISYTPLLADGILIIEQGDVVLKLGFPAVRLHAQMLAGFLEQAKQSEAEAEIRQAVSQLQAENRQRRKAAKKPPQRPGRARPLPPRPVLVS